MTKKEFLVAWLMEWGRRDVVNAQLYAKGSVYMRYVDISRVQDIERIPTLVAQGLIDRSNRRGGFSGELQYRLSDAALEYIKGEQV